MDTDKIMTQIRESLKGYVKSDEKLDNAIAEIDEDELIKRLSYANLADGFPEYLAYSYVASVVSDNIGWDVEFTNIAEALLCCVDAFDPCDWRTRGAMYTLIQIDGYMQPCDLSDEDKLRDVADKLAFLDRLYYDGATLLRQ